MPTTKELIKENIDLLNQNYDFAKKLNACERRQIELDNRVSILEALIKTLQSQVVNLQQTIESQQRQIDILKHQ